MEMDRIWAFRARLYLIVFIELFGQTVLHTFMENQTVHHACIEDEKKITLGRKRKLRTFLLNDLTASRTGTFC
jgi:hypothetical protein